MACQRCGHCCVKVFFTHSALDLGQDDKEMGAFFRHHHCEVVTLEKDNQTMLGIRIPLVCKHLSFQNGLSSCAIYERRPVICKEYECARAKEDK